MARDEDVARAIRQRDIGLIVRLMFQSVGLPTVRSGFRTETELWDFKKDCPRPGGDLAPWADLSSEVLSFHNLRGGVMIFGITDGMEFCGATHRLDSKLVNDQLRRYLGDRIWVEFHREFIQPDQKYVGIALIPPRGPNLERFVANAPLVSGKRLFEAGGSAIRQGDSTRLLTKDAADALARSIAVPSLGRVYAVDEPFFRVLQPEYVEFIERPGHAAEIERGLHDKRTAITSLIGIGGAGKTALATWATLRAYERRQFGFIVSITAKDRELTSSGIQALEPGLTSFEALLDNTLDVLGFSDAKQQPLEPKEKQVRELIAGSNGLLFVDNLETVDDARIIAFLDNLPDGCRALTTSRRSSVRVSVRPVDIGPLLQDEVIAFVASLKSQAGFSYVANLNAAERIRVGEACAGIPLAIRWVLARSESASEALSIAESVRNSSRDGDELLEFCFRRVFDAMSQPEKAVMQVLALFNRPVLAEALLVGANLPPFKLFDAIEQLVADALIQRLFDPDRNDYSYTMLPLTRGFVYSEVVRHPDLEQRIRKTLGDWFEARDVRDPDERLVVREIRQGATASESALLDLAQAADRRGDVHGARQLYEQALARNPRSWKAPRLLAEFHRHKTQNYAEALRLYEQAAANAPRRGAERALIFREWGMLLRDSGDARATDHAVEKFETALQESPNDHVAIHALAHMLDRKGNYQRVIQLLEPLLGHRNERTRSMATELLLRAYERTGDILKHAELKNRKSSL